MVGVSACRSIGIGYGEGGTHPNNFDKQAKKKGTSQNHENPNLMGVGTEHSVQYP